ncbi:MAG: 30S ribosomal protein S19 [Candidatus Marsarchaeota archaeon]|jgi:small subunit ribosomal protein S19
MSTVFRYRGYTMEQLQNMNVGDLATLFKARERRFITRNYRAYYPHILKQMEKKKGSDKPIKTHLRELVILPQMVDYTFAVYNGKEFVPVKITPEMIGHRLGEFSITCKRVIHGEPGLKATRSSFAVPLK